jgi:serine/threonine protein kinase
MYSRQAMLETQLQVEYSAAMVEMKAKLERAQQQIDSLKQIIVEHEKETGLVVASSATGRECNNCQWIIDKREIHIPELKEKMILGQGGWAMVTIATFRKTQVAAKCFYGEILSNYNRHLFNREMNMAARLRHPNLVQFIGATSTIDREPIIITELMSTSLRQVLVEQKLNFLQIKCIGLDVSRALNYLHNMKPDPIIHRDISSGNVLLDPLPQNLWKAKVADYGSVNLFKELKTVGPGSPAYAAPEATSPPHQSPKMDIFSFGILLIEMFTGKFPDVESHNQLKAEINRNDYLRIVNMCLKRNPSERPTAELVIDELAKLTC